MNAMTYREIFPLIKDNKMWIGYGFNMSMVFRTTYPNLLEANRQYVRNKGYDPDQNYVKTPAIAWFTNLDIKKRHETLDLYKHYTPEEYPKFDNYDAINVDRVSDIPMDYDGVMGVPITFLDKYNPDQFEIIGMAKRGAGDPALKSKVYTKEDYPNYSDLNATPVIIKDGVPKNTYPRLLIRRRIII